MLKTLWFVRVWSKLDSGGVKTSKQRAEVSILSSVESVKMQRDG